MNLRLLIITGYLLAGLSLQAAPFKLKSLKIGSTTFTNVNVLGANATDLFFEYSHGLMNVKLRYVDAGLQKRFNYDPDMAGRIEAKQAADDLAYRTHLAEAAATAALAKKNVRATNQTAVVDASLADPLSDKSPLGKPGPALNADKWIGDKPSFEGKYVLVSFWATWSAPSCKFIPELNDFQKKFADKLVVVGFTPDTEAQVTQMDDPKIEFSWASDPQSKFGAEAGITSIPTVLLMDPNHVVLYQGHPAALTAEALQNILEKSGE